MELTTPEMEKLTNVSRYQLSRYASDGRLERTRHGHYAAESFASLASAFDVIRHKRDRGDRQEWFDHYLADCCGWFRRKLREIVQSRRVEVTNPIFKYTRNLPIPESEIAEMAAAVESFRARLVARDGAQR
jgi:hypothetical protein